jgi:tetratricopeptide (TPR) repeat protein
VGSSNASAEKSDPFGRAPAPAADPFGGGPSSSPSNPGAAASSGQWVLRKAGGEEVLDINELRERIKAGTVRGDDLCAPVGETPKPAREHGALGVALGVPKTVEKPRVSGARASGMNLSVPKPLLAAVGALVLVVGGGFVLLKVKPELFEKQSDAGINPLRRARPLWQRQFPDVEGTAQEHFVEGRKQMQLDTAAGYRKADDELRQSLLLDIGNTGAMAAWAENFANLPTARADLDGSTLAKEAVEYALKKEPDNVELLRAQAALRLSVGDVDDAQRILNRAKTAAPSDVDTLVLLARSHLDRSPSDALAIIQRDVRAKVPDLKVAYTIEGAAQRRLGAFKESRELLEARLVSDPANVGALKEVAKLELDLGHADAALKALTKLLDAEDKDVEAHLLRAKITYQIKGGKEGLAAADTQLTEVLAKHEGAAGDLLLSVLAHATFVKTQLGQLDEAIKLGERARATDPTFPSALYTLGRAYAQKGDLENAKKTLEQAVRATEQREQFFEPLVRAELAAVQARAGDEQNAVRNNEKVVEYDPRNQRAFFSLAATFMKNGKAAQAMTIMRRALANDPAWEHDRQVLTDYPTPPSDLIAYADAFRDARIDAKDESLGSLRSSAEGIIRYHAGERDKASALFLTALRIDRNNDAALLYQGLMDLDAGRVQDGRKRFRTAVDSTAGRSPVTRMYLARADLMSGDVEGARKQLQDLVETEPTLVQARYSLAMVLRAQKLEAQAKNELTAVVRQDPDYLPAKQALADKG